jgi:hypothetical protein
MRLFFIFIKILMFHFTIFFGTKILLLIKQLNVLRIVALFYMKNIMTTK